MMACGCIRGKWIAIVLAWCACGCSRQPPLNSKPIENLTVGVDPVRNEPGALGRLGNFWGHFCDSMATRDWLYAAGVLALLVVLVAFLMWKRRLARIAMASERYPSAASATIGEVALPSAADMDLAGQPALYLGGLPSLQPGQSCSMERGSDGLLWLRFVRDGSLTLPDFQHAYGRDGSPNAAHSLAPATVQFRAGQLVKVVDFDRVNEVDQFQPTVCSYLSEIHISPPYAAVPVNLKPEFERMQTVFGRSAEEVPFWRALLAAPKDELPRLVYADWLDERSDPAGSILRGNVPLKLHGVAAVGGRFEHRNSRNATWDQAVDAMRSLAELAGMTDFPDEPEQVALSRFEPRAGVPRREWLRNVGLPREDIDPAAGDELTGEFQSLRVTHESGEPIPPFVSYLLAQLGMALAGRLEGGLNQQMQTSESPNRI